MLLNITVMMKHRKKKNYNCVSSMPSCLLMRSDIRRLSRDAVPCLCFLRLHMKTTKMTKTTKTRKAKPVPNPNPILQLVSSDGVDGVDGVGVVTLTLGRGVDRLGAIVTIGVVGEGRGEGVGEEEERGFHVCGILEKYICVLSYMCFIIIKVHIS